MIKVTTAKDTPRIHFTVPTYQYTCFHHNTGLNKLKMINLSKMKLGVLLTMHIVFFTMTRTATLRPYPMIKQHIHQKSTPGRNQ